MRLIYSQDTNTLLLKRKKEKGKKTERKFLRNTTHAQVGQKEKYAYESLTGWIPTKFTQIDVAYI